MTALIAGDGESVLRGAAASAADGSAAARRFWARALVVAAPLLRGADPASAAALVEVVLGARRPARFTCRR